MPAKGYKGTRRNNIISPKYHKKFCKEIGIEISYETHRQIIIDSNKLIVDILVEGEDGFRLPKGLGVMVVSKYKSKSDKKPIDWKNSNKFKKRIYLNNLHSYGYQVKIKWFRIDTTQLAHAAIYKFKAARTFARAVAAKTKETNASNYFIWKYEDYKQTSKLEVYMRKKFGDKTFD